MKVKLRIRKQATLYEAVHAITDAESSGRASADVWVQMRNRWLQKAANIPRNPIITRPGSMEMLAADAPAHHPCRTAVLQRRSTCQRGDAARGCGALGRARLVRDRLQHLASLGGAIAYPSCSAFLSSPG